MRNSKLRIADNVVFEIVEGRAILLHLHTGTYFSLNKSGTLVWRLIDDLGDLSLVREAMYAEYQVPQGAIDEDLDHMIATLEEKGLLVVARQ